VAQRAPDERCRIVAASRRRSEAEQQAAFRRWAAARAGHPKLLVGALDQLAAGKVQPGAQLELIEPAEERCAGGESPLGKAAGGLDRERQCARAYSFALAAAIRTRRLASSSEQVLPCARCTR
jgi:hypothetical protein